jgi:hypothetical protein
LDSQVDPPFFRLPTCINSMECFIYGMLQCLLLIDSSGRDTPRVSRRWRRITRVSCAFRLGNKPVSQDGLRGKLKSNKINVSDKNLTVEPQPLDNKCIWCICRSLSEPQEQPLARPASAIVVQDRRGGTLGPAFWVRTLFVAVCFSGALSCEPSAASGRGTRDLVCHRCKS